MNSSKMEIVNLREKFQKFSDQWSPKIVGELNGQYVKLVKVEGEFIWHKHDHEDEMFLVVDGSLMIHFRDHSIKLDKGEFYIVPRGVEHKPEAKNEAQILLLEPKSTDQTGKVETELRVDEQPWI